MQHFLNITDYQISATEEEMAVIAHNEAIWREAERSAREFINISFIVCLNLWAMKGVSLHTLKHADCWNKSKTEKPTSIYHFTEQTTQAMGKAQQIAPLSVVAQ